jgi:hypothetical protein
MPPCSVSGCGPRSDRREPQPWRCLRFSLSRFARSPNTCFCPVGVGWAGCSQYSSESPNPTTKRLSMDPKAASLSQAQKSGSSSSRRDSVSSHDAPRFGRALSFERVSRAVRCTVRCCSTSQARLTLPRLSISLRGPSAVGALSQVAAILGYCGNRFAFSRSGTAAKAILS